MHNYVVFYNGKTAELQADSLYAAKLKAIDLFKPRKSQQHMISVMFADATHSTSEI